MPAATTPPLASPLTPDRLKQLPRLIPRKRSSPPQNPLPIPETPTLPAPPDLSDWVFVRPTRRILSPSDLEEFQSSSTRDLIVSFVFSLSESAADKKISSISPTHNDPILSKLFTILDDIEATVKACPRIDQGGSRFGNPSFRTFLDSVAAQSPEWHRDLHLPSDACISEVSTYLNHSLGNRNRIDYGSGHELNFIIWLLCLNRLSLLPPSLFPVVTLLVFPRYVKLLRTIQSTYYLEPAGSHGVWGLDDYQFLPFLFGASQLLHHPYIRPLSIHNDLVLDEEGDEYLYLDMIRFTMASKTVRGLKWTQPMLDDISGAKSWEKVEQGMRRMFMKEVLGKLPIMQHFLFGSLVPAVDGMSKEREHGMQPGQVETGDSQPEPDHDHGTGHVHNNEVWGDCCGIKLPSNVAAAQEARKRGDQDSFRRIPFD